MLVLTALNNLLQQTLSLPSIHTAVLITCQGQLVSTAHDPSRSKDEIRIVVGLCAEVWRETGQQKPFAMLDSEVSATTYSFCSFLKVGQYGHILVLPVDEQSEGSQDPAEEPFMLLALNGTSTASWDDLKSKVGLHWSLSLFTSKAYHLPSGKRIGNASRQASQTISWPPHLAHR
jgi:hypothetical protein